MTPIGLLFWTIAIVLSIVQFCAIFQLFAIRKDLQRLTESLAPLAPEQAPLSDAVSLSSVWRGTICPKCNSESVALFPSGDVQCKRCGHQWRPPKESA
jgi:RNase P subunit RPR2